MGTTQSTENFWQIYFTELKQIFGNKKNYDRYIEQRRWMLWNCWLLSLGYRQ